MPESAEEATDSAPARAELNGVSPGDLDTPRGRQGRDRRPEQPDRQVRSRGPEKAGSAGLALGRGGVNVGDLD
jgi:hypothetical protein